MDSASSVCNFDLAEVVLELDLDGGVSDRLRCKLVKVDVHRDFAIVVAPRELLDLSLLNDVGWFFVCRLGRNQLGRTAVHETFLLFEVLDAFSIVIAGRVRVVVRVCTFALDVVQECVVCCLAVQHFVSLIFLLLFNVFSSGLRGF